MSKLTTLQYQRLVADIRNLISSTKKRLEGMMENELVITYWQIGRRIEKEKIINNNNNYSSILVDLSREVELEPSILRRTASFFRAYPRGFGKKDNLLSWSHYKSLIAIKDESLRSRLEEKAKEEGWGRNKLIEAIKVRSAQDRPSSSDSKLQRPLSANYLYKATIDRVVDGDTMILDIDLGFQVIKKQRVRLAGINTPELKTPKGKEVFEYLHNLALELEEVVIKTNKIDIYGRYVGDIFYASIQGKKKIGKQDIFEKGTYLNEELVTKKFAKIV
jgi:endonuclease YncB( thermonuclease family)